MIYHFTSEEEQGEEIQLLNENRDAGIGNVKYRNIHPYTIIWA